MITNTAVQVPLSDGASPTGEMTKSVKNPKKDRKTKKSKGKIQSKIVSPPSPTYVSSVFKPDPPDVNKSTLKIDPSRLADTRGHLFGVCNDESQDAERLMKAAEKRAQLRDTHEELFGHSTPDESPRAQKPARENTMKNLFGEAEPISVRTRRRWEDDSHKTLFGADPRTEKQIARPLRSENTKENLFPVGESGAIDATYPWRRRPKRRQLLREDTQTSLFGMTTGSEDCAVPLVRRASSPSTARSHELMFNNAPQQQQQLDAHTPSVGLRAPTTHEKLFGMPLTPGGPDERVDELRTPKFLPVQLHRVESPKTFEHVFPSRHTSDSLAPDEIRKNSNADCRFPIRLHRVESPKTYLYGQPDETANDQIQPKTTPERYTSKNPKAISVSKTH